MSLDGSNSLAALYTESAGTSAVLQQVSPGSGTSFEAKNGSTQTVAGLSIAVISPDDRYQKQIFRPLALALHPAKQIPYYPDLDQVSAVARLGHNVFIIDLDSDQEAALKLVEGFSKIEKAFVIATSHLFSMDLVVHAMRAGAREILSLPASEGELNEVIARAKSRISAPLAQALGRLCVFIGAKGGCGTTTIASNFAFTAALASEKPVLLIDLDLPLGDAALNFGLQPEFSTMDALDSHQRLDATLLNHYITRHESGLFVLPAQGRYARCEISREAIDKLILVARQEFDCVVLDAGTRFDLADTAIFHSEAQIYLVSQTSIADLRNSNRIVSQLQSGGRPRNVQVVLNRDSSDSSFDDDQLTRALTQAVHWRVPNDFKAVRDMQYNGVPIATKDSAIAQAIRGMARAGLDLPVEPEKKKKKVLGLF